MTTLNLKVQLLKNNIQDILNKTQINDSDMKKKEQYTLELSETLLKCKAEKREKEFDKICRGNDTIAYFNIKKKPNASELMSNLKINREKAKEIFQKTAILTDTYTLTENELIKNSNINLPLFLFFFKDIQMEYKMCPFIELNDTCLLNRQEWITKQSDGGKLYYDLYNKIINKEIYNQYININDNLENYFDKFHTDLLNKTHHDIFLQICKDIIEYKSTRIKTKKIKDKLNIIINNLSLLYNETGYQIHEYLSIYFNLNIPINNSNNSNNSSISNMNLIKIYDDKLDNYKINKGLIETSLKYITNTINNLKNMFNDFLYAQSIYIPPIKQDGQYFKKWSLLSNDEKLNRYYSFADFFVKKFLIESKLIDNLEESVYIELLKTLLKDNHENQKLVYKNIKWNVKRGFIEHIPSIKYNSEKNLLYLDINTTGVDKKDTKIRKISSIRTIFNKLSEKIINEELIVFLISNKKNNTLHNEKINELKTLFIEQIKLKLKLNRLSVKDRTEIHTKFDNMYNIVYNNQL